LRILALSDQVVGFLYRPTIRDRFGDIDLLVGCGDLPSEYLEYMLTQLNVPLLYVAGNHDPDDLQVPGGRSIDGRIVRQGSLRFAGLGGSLRYKRDGRHQYTEAEMRLRSLALMPSILAARAAGRRGIDVLVTHAPPRGLHEGPDFTHRGFFAFRLLLRLARPQVMLHGHSHIHINVEAQEDDLLGVRVLNVFPQRVLELGKGS
jgi:Icc-related predicted phosphoesterase